MLNNTVQQETRKSRHANRFNKKLIGYSVLISLFFLQSCATYRIPVDSLLTQFAGTGTEKKMAPMFFYKAVKGNDLRQIQCLDKNGKTETVLITNQTSVRVTKTDKRRVIFYFDTLILQDSTITGSKTHFFNAHIKPIPFSNIAFIELQKH